jgi:hypothetical protein
MQSISVVRAGVPGWYGLVEGVEEKTGVVFGLLELYLSYWHLNNANTNLQLLVGGYFLVPLAVPNKNRRRRYQVPK